MAIPEVTRLIHSLLVDVGEDPARDGLRDTPKRVAKAYVDALSGYSTRASSIIGDAVFHEPLVSRSSGGVVLVRDIDFAATCDATLMPFHGQCHVAYVPTDSSILGLSKLARLVNAFSKRLCSPDGLCHELTQAIASCTPSNGVYVQVSAKHLASAASQQRVFAERYTGVFDQPHSTQLKEARLLLRSNTREAPAATRPSSDPLPPVTPDADPPRAHLLDTVASKVACVYATLLQDTGSSLRPGAAETFASVFLRQTSGYFRTLPRILEQHHGSGPHVPVATKAPDHPGPLSDSTISLLTDLTMHDGAPDSPASTPVSDAGDTSDTQSASSSGLGCCPCGAAAAAPRLRDLPFGCGGSDTSLSDRASGAAPAPESPWQPHCGGRVRFLDAAAAARQSSLPCNAAARGTIQMWSVDFATQCEHHILPFYGTLHAVLMPGGSGREVSASCLCDIVDMFSLRLQVQERLTHEVADALREATGGAVLVVCSAAHMCMVARGVEKHGAETMTTAARGWLQEDAPARNSWLEHLLDSLAM